MLAFQAITTAAKAWKCETTHACCHKDMVAHWRARRQSAWRASGCRHGRSYIPASGTDFACHLNWLLKILVPSPTLDRFHQNFWGGKTGTSTFKSSLGNSNMQLELRELLDSCLLENHPFLALDLTDQTAHELKIFLWFLLQFSISTPTDTGYLQLPNSHLDRYKKHMSISSVCLFVCLFLEERSLLHYQKDIWSVS